jgi:deoxyadenosine/deoxycytidine kinase
LNRIAIRAYEGLVAKEKLIESLNVFWADAKYNLKQNHIIDFTKTDLVLSTADIKAVVDVIVTNANYRDRIVSFVVAKPQEAAITTMYKELAQHKHVSEVFVSKIKALEFINAPSDFYKMLKSKDAVTIEL